MSSTTSKNLGQVSSVIYGTTAPSNKKLVWYDTNFNPARIKLWDESVQSWGELIFVMSPTTTLKRLITNNIADDQQYITITTQDCIIKTKTGDSFINLPVADHDVLGKVIEISNLAISGNIYFNYPLLTTNLMEQESMPPNSSMKIICAVSSDINATEYAWYVLNSNTLTSQQ